MAYRNALSFSLGATKKDLPFDRSLHVSIPPKVGWKFLANFGSTTLDNYKRCDRPNPFFLIRPNFAFPEKSRHQLSDFATTIF